MFRYGADFSGDLVSLGGSPFQYVLSGVIAYNGFELARVPIVISRPTGLTGVVEMPYP
jgi:hypothetical protein